MGLGIAQCSFDQSNAMLALSAIFKFSAKNITDTLPWFFIIKNSFFAQSSAEILRCAAAHRHP